MSTSVVNPKGSFSKALESRNFRPTMELANKSIGSLLNAIRETGKPGEITLTIAIKPDPKFGQGAVIVKPKVKVKLPEPDIAQKQMFIEEDGGLVEEDPRQTQIAFSDAESKAPVIDVE